MTPTRVLAALVASFTIGGATVLLAAPSSGRAASQTCPNVACAVNQEQGLWCQFVPGHGCSMPDARHCDLSTC